jgi:hypothetical protein
VRTFLTERLLAKIMRWAPEEISEERPLLQALAEFKYDQYQQFSPGIRFIESLAKWLEQFDFEERKTAYDFIKRRLIFISNDQINHLVNTTFTDKINPILIEKTAEMKKISQFKIKEIILSSEYKESLRKSLFIGLSDGARIDLLRRSKVEISNEQVFPSYHISEKKAIDMISELSKAGFNGKFNSVFLIDDFTASGKSYFRVENDAFTGKIYKFLQDLFYNDDQKHLRELVDISDGFTIHVIFYLATELAINSIRDALKMFVATQGIRVNCDVHAVQLIEQKISDDVIDETAFIELIAKEEYFDKSVMDSHYQKGDCKRPYLGFNGCALPLILSHNTPNNSLPILWFAEDSERVGLFPRITRHKDE